MPNQRRIVRERNVGGAVVALGCLSSVLMVAFYGLILVALGLGVYWLWGQVV